MKRRAFVACLAGCLFAIPVWIMAQPAKVPRVGFLRTDRPPQSYIDAFEQQLRERGYVPGKTIIIEYRLADGVDATVDRLARELVDAKVDVIVAGGGRATRAAQRATATIPIVMTSASDPVATGLVASLSRPGANITGTSIVSWDLFAKRLELVKQVLPNASRVAVVVNRFNPAPANAWNEALASAARLGVSLQRVEVQSPADFDAAFASMIKERADAFIVAQSTIFETPPYRIQALAASNHLPGFYGVRVSAEQGGLMSYGPSVPALYGYSAVIVDKILKGAKPGDIPVEQPTKFELVVNMRTAKALGLTIPGQVLLRADEVIQ